MVEVVELVRLSDIGDVEITGGVHAIGNYVFIAWYHDLNYQYDEYGCKQLPNIFHNWIVKVEKLRQGSLEHVNVFGKECTPYVLWNFVGLWLAAFLPGYENRNLLVIGGYDYSDYRSRLFIIDVTNPENPRHVKTILGTTQIRNDGAFLTCSKKVEQCLIGCFGVGPTGGKAYVYRVGLRKLAEIETMEGLELVEEDVSGVRLINHRYAVGGGAEKTGKAGKRYLIDIVHATVTEIAPSDAPGIAAGRYGITIDGNVVHGFLIREYDYEYIGRVTLPVAPSRYGVYVVGDGRFTIIDGERRMYIVRVDDNSIALEHSLTIQQVVARCDMLQEGVLICGKPGFTVQSIIEVRPDKRYIVLPNTRVKVVDENGNPVEGVELAVYEMDIFRTVDRVWDKAIQCNIGTYLGSVYTGSDGTADLSRFGQRNMIVLPRW